MGTQGGGLLLTAVVAVATLIVSLLTLRRATKGPRLVPSFTADWRTSGDTLRAVVVENTVVDAPEARVTFVGDVPARVDGRSEWPRFAKGQKVVLHPVYGWGAGLDKRVRVEWKPLHRDDPGWWESHLP